MQVLLVTLNCIAIKNLISKCNAILVQILGILWKSTLRNNLCTNETLIKLDTWYTTKEQITLEIY